MTARWITADVFDGLATLDDGSVDLVITSPPFLALRSYLPADHPDKGKEIGSEPTPAAFIDVMLTVTAELRRVLAPHGSICVELGDTYAGSVGFNGTDDFSISKGRGKMIMSGTGPVRNRTEGWPLAKSKTLIPELYRLALAYGINPLTGQQSPAGRWRVRNTVTWCRPNPPVGALGDKWRPATSDIVIACTSDKRYWDDIATRRPLADSPGNRYVRKVSQTDNARRPDGSQAESTDNRITKDYDPSNSTGAPLLDYWEVPPGGYPGSHYAVYPPALVEPLIKAMAPPKVCETCGEPSRRIVEKTPEYAAFRASKTGVELTDARKAYHLPEKGGAGSIDHRNDDGARGELYETVGWSDCGHDNWRLAHILDPFAGSGTTLAVATGHGHNATGIDLDERNRDLAYERIGPFLFEEVDASSAP